MLPPLAIVFALLVGFLAAQDWNDADRASTAVTREASALRAVVLLASAFPGETETRVRNLVRLYIHDAVRLAVTLSPRGDGQVAAQREMIASLQIALDARRQRIILSRSSIDWVKWTVLLVQAGLTLLTVGMIHSDNRATNRIIMTIFATGVGVAVVLIASHSGPFSGRFPCSPPSCSRSCQRLRRRLQVPEGERNQGVYPAGRGAADGSARPATGRVCLTFPLVNAWSGRRRPAWRLRERGPGP